MNADNAPDEHPQGCRPRTKQDWCDTFRRAFAKADRFQRFTPREIAVLAQVAAETVIGQE